VTVFDMLTHLSTTYSTITCNDLERNRASIATLWSPSDPIETLWDCLREVQRIAAAGGDPLSDATLIELTTILFESTGMFTLACDMWCLKPTTNKTYTEFRDFFTTENKERLRKTITSATSGFHSANAATTAPVRPPAAPATAPPMTPTGSAIANDGTHVFYCWTHGLGFNQNHTSATCSKPADGHCQTTTIKNMHGGNNTIMSNHRKPKPTDATATAAGTAANATTTPAAGAAATAA